MRLLCRFLFAAVLACAAVTFAADPAQALTEYCPASVSGFTPIDASAKPASLYSFYLSAEGQRTVEGTVMVETDAGWFAVGFAAAPLTERYYRYVSPAVSYTKASFESALQYVRFPKPVTVQAAYVASAEALSDAAFGWEKRGFIACQAPAALGSVDAEKYGDLSTYPVLQNPRTLTIPPTSDSLIVPALAAPLPGSVNCDQPFRAPIAKKIVPVELSLGINVTQRLTTLIEIAVSPTGQLDDAWIDTPSGSKSFDLDALNAARRSRFTGGTSFCEPAPGRFIIRADFNPD